MSAEVRELFRAAGTASDPKPGLKCDVEIDCTGDHEEAVATTTAKALRDLATQIEEGKLDTGFHPIKTSSGEEIGEVYLDYYATSSD